MLELGGITREEAEHVSKLQREKLEKELVGRQERFVCAAQRYRRLLGVLHRWPRARGGTKSKRSLQGIELCELLEKQTHVPTDFHPHPKIRRLLEHAARNGRRRPSRSIGPPARRWRFASLATQGLRMRLSGQDTRARHVQPAPCRAARCLRWPRLHAAAHLAPDQAPVEIYNSPLSEAGVLGFEYGYSLDCPDGLVLWEAQFGDFFNAAQVIIDQFIVSAEDKWRRLSGIVLLLPHGFEGQGPEHSSARLERFLTLAAKDNIQVVMPTTPAQYFHFLRRQVLRVWRKPLVVMTPKSLLRHPKVVSTMEECAEGGFQRVIPDAAPAGRTTIERVLLCSGKFITSWSRSGWI